MTDSQSVCASLSKTHFAMAPKVDPALHLLGGAGSGMIACTVLQPLDLLKTRLQQQRQDHLAFLREAKNKGLLVAPQKR